MDVFGVIALVARVCDADGRATFETAVPSNPGFAGVELFAQALFSFPSCAHLSDELASSRGLTLTLWE